MTALCEKRYYLRQMTHNRQITVLYADDDAALRFVFTEMLSALGHSVVAVDDGTPALQAWQDDQTRFDGVVLDVHMPLLAGPTTAERLRTAGCTVPIWLCTGDSVADDQAKRLNADGILHKPFRLATLQKLIDVMVGQG